MKRPGGRRTDREVGRPQPEDTLALEERRIKTPSKSKRGFGPVGGRMASTALKTTGHGGVTMKINTNNADQLRRTLRDLQSNVKVRTVDELDVSTAASSAEDHLERFGVVKSKRKGARFVYTVGFGGKVPNSYTGTPMGTIATLERGATDWFLVGVRRGTAPNTTRIEWVNCEDWKEEILESAERVG